MGTSRGSPNVTARHCVRIHSPVNFLKSLLSRVRVFIFEYFNVLKTVNDVFFDAEPKQPSWRSLGWKCTLKSDCRKTFYHEVTYYQYAASRGKNLLLRLRVRVWDGVRVLVVCIIFQCLIIGMVTNRADFYSWCKLSITNLFKKYYSGMQHFLPPKSDMIARLSASRMLWLKVKQYFSPQLMIYRD